MALKSAPLQPRGGVRRIAGTLALLAATAVAAPGGRPGTVGNYELTFVGAFRGTGTAKINPAHLSIKADLQGVDGPGGQLDVPKLKIENGRFNGSGTLGGQAVDLSGRVDAAEGGIVKTARMLITLRTADGRFARGIGELEVKKG